MLVYLIDITKDEHPNGNVKGKAVYAELMSLVESNQHIDTFGISMRGIVATDASFPRESVIAIAAHYRSEKFFYLTDMEDEDLFDNWSYAAIAKEQPMTVWSNGKAQFIGPAMSKAVKELTEFILSKGKVTTSQVASRLDISTQNSSTRLKNLYKQGYVKRSEEVAETGGKEFVYEIIKF